MQNYKEYHEEYMKNLNGTTSWETFSLIFPSFFKVFIATTISSLIFDNIIASKFKCVIIHFITDFCTIIFPIILSLTVLDKVTTYFIIFLIIVCLGIILVFYSKIQEQTLKTRYSSNSKRHFVTNARSTILIISIIAILAVDFKIFPRRFAKTETFGYSLMDVGVGLFVFSNGIVAPEIHKQTQSFLKSIISSLPLWILGSIRFFLTKQTDYHVHVSEYGVHWNFFITLAVTKILTSLILNFVNIKYSLMISIIILILHETLLHIGLSNWVLSNIPRNNYLLANREGLVSSLGYVGLYFLSVYVGKILSKSKADRKLSFQLLLISIVLLCSVLLSDKYLGTSRRLANAGYCFWIMFLGTFMCLLFLCAEHINKYLYNLKNQTNQIFVPLIYEAVSYNGLACFLLANVLTGFINLNVQTLTVEPVNSLIIISVYMFATCSVMTLLYINNVKLKLW